MPEDLMNFVVRKKEEHYIDRFKNQNALMKRFGEDGIKVYVVLDENKSVGQMLHESGVSEDKFVEILEFMDHEGMVKLEHSMPETALLRPQAPNQAGQAGQKVEQKQAPMAPVAMQASPRPGPSGISPKIQIIQQTEEYEEQKPQAAEQRETEFGQSENRRRPPVPGIMRDEHTATPLPPEYHREKLLQPAEEESVVRQKAGQIEIKQVEEEVGRPSGLEEDAQRPEDMLSPLERIIYEKFGREGVDIYNMIDGEKTAEQILKETGVSETRLVEILEFMDDEGIIKLEKPNKAAGAEKKPEQKELQFEPILDDKEQLDMEPVPQEDRRRNVPVGLPVPRPVGVFTRMETKLKLSLRYRGRGQRLLSAIDGKKDTVQLSKELGIPLGEIDRILGSLAKRRAISLDPVTEARIKDIYGGDGLKICKRYGREGLLVYELIGRERSIKDLVMKSGIEPARAVDIVLFIHKVLGLGVSLNKEMLYRQLGIKERPN